MSPRILRVTVPGPLIVLMLLLSLPGSEGKTVGQSG
jgi:hypothetical protein